MTIEHKEYDLGNGRKITAYYNEQHITEVSEESFEKIIVPALAKQEPMIPIWCDLENGSRVFCRACGFEIAPSRFGYAYCCKCGQKINWMEDEE